jgi:molecular chaperone DnaJ
VSSIDEYYQRLGLPNTASPAEIKRAYRRLRGKYHPDRNSGRESKVELEFKRIQEAFEILTGKRVAPSAARAASSNTARHPAPRKHTPPRPQPSAEPAARPASPASPQWDAAAATRTHVGPMAVRGANLHQPLYAPVEVALNGGDVLTSYPFTGICRKCEGTSSTRFSANKCPSCDGHGQSPDGQRCAICAGAGRLARSPMCPACQGKGIESYQKTHTVSVPAGAWDGQRLVVAGEGFPGVHGGVAGDAVFSVNVVCNTDIQRDGLNLSMSLPIDFVTATLGGALETKMLGRDLSVTIPPNAQQGSVIRLPGKGLFDASGNRGELRLQIVLVMPKAAAHLTDEQRQALAAMFEDAARRAS